MLPIRVDGSWLPIGVPDDVFGWHMAIHEWDTEPPFQARYVLTKDASAYEMAMAPDGRVEEIIGWCDGTCVGHWVREPRNGVWHFRWREVSDGHETANI